MNLHKHLPGLSFFLMMSSISGIVGNVSQANYNAGNTFQDALARHRTSQGQPAVAIDLGAVKGVGWIAKNGEEYSSLVQKSLTRGGASAKLLDIERILRMVEAAIQEPLRATPDDSQVITCLAPWDTLGEDTAIKRDRRFRTLCIATSRSASGKSSSTASETAHTTSGLLSRGLSAAGTSVADGAKAIVSAMVAKLSDIFSIAAEEIDIGLPLSHYGVDSLVAVELRNWLNGAAKAKVSVFDILQTPSLNEFAALAAEKSEYLRAGL